MSAASTSRTALRRAPAVVIGFVALLLCLLPATALAHAGHGKKNDRVRVMTRNVYLGADLSPGLSATNPDEFFAANGAILRQVTRTNFPLRAEALAKEIRREHADLVGLQEVALWRKQTPSDLGAPPINPNATPATQVEQDFLAILRRELKRVGAKYRVVVVQREFDAELPVDVDGSDTTGTGPWPGSAPTSTRG